MAQPPPPASPDPAQYERFFDLSADLLCVVDAAGYFARVNRTFERVTGYSAAELTAVPYLTFVHPDDHAATIAEGRRVLEGTATFAFENRYRCRDGAYRWFAWNAAPASDGGAIYAIARDVTDAVRERRGALLLAEASAAFAGTLDYRDTLNNVARLVVPALADWCAIDLVETDDLLSRVAVVGPEGADGAIARVMRDDPNRVPVLRRVIGCGRPDLLADSAARGGGGDGGRDAAQLAGLRELGIAASMVVPLAARGRTLGAISLIATVSGRRYDARDLALAVDLAGRAALAVDNARLYRDAQGAVRAREQFLTVATHELRTPLTAIRGNAELLLRRVRRPGGELDRAMLDERLTRLLSGIDRMAALAARLLDVTRMQTGAFEITPVPCDLAPIVAAAVERARGTAPKEPATAIEPDLPDAPVLGRFDPVRIEQVLTNLLDNAVKYQPKGGTVRVGLVARDQEAALTVADEGIGIAPDDLPRLFASFVRADTAVSQQIGGVGVGLYISDQIIRRHGGKIEVRSAVGEGTTFIVRLPLA